MALHTKSQYCQAPTRAILLTTYVKWVNVFPEIKGHLVNVLERYRYVLDAELQQRACEYYAIATMPDDDLLQKICEEMPPFPPRESTLLNRLNKKHGDTEDGRVWVIGGKEANEDRETRGKGRKSTLDLIGGTKSNSSTPIDGPSGSDVLASLAGLDISNSTTPAVPKPVLNSSPSIDRWFEKLCVSNDGILYEDPAIQIGIKSEYHGHLGRIALYVGNKVGVPLASFTATVTGHDPEALSVTFAKIPANMVNPRTQAQHIIHLECKKPFTSMPIIMISYLAGSLTTINLQLPVPLTKFFEGISLNQNDFFERWKAIGGPPLESQNIFAINLDPGGLINTPRSRKIVSGHSFSLLDSVDPNTTNLVGAGILHTSGTGKHGCLLRVEPNKDAKVRGHCIVGYHYDY
jgi:AP-2 complex subunit alpha